MPCALQVGCCSFNPAPCPQSSWISCLLARGSARSYHDGLPLSSVTSWRHLILTSSCHPFESLLVGWELSPKAQWSAF